MGYVFGYSACAKCGLLFSYNPRRVPSVRVNGVREPLCRHCIDRNNLKLIEKGLQPFEPLPGAYEVCDESELE